MRAHAVLRRSGLTVLERGLPNLVFMKALRRDDGFTLIDMLVVMALLAIVIAMALPTVDTTSRGFRLKGDAQSLANIVSLAKMRAASRYSRTRVRADLTSSSFRLEVWVPTNAASKLVGSWIADTGDTRLSNGVTFSVAGRTVPPDNTQTVLGQSATCSDQNSLTANKVANTACIVFNSRGIPIDDNGDPMGGNALYISDGSSVYGTTITATPLVRQWWANSTTGAWVKQ
jgi:prepilin-type N-terminal cleavage/methylation domain-containing protein